MPKNNPKLSNQLVPVNWSIVVNSVHVIAFKLWHQTQGSADWTVISEGNSTDNIADVGEFEAKKGDKFSYWLGIGSTIPGSIYNISVVLAQEGVVLENGLMQDIGSVNDDGVESILEIVEFI